MAEIENAGRKGYCLMSFIIFVILFVLLVVWIYNRNYAGVPIN